MSTRHDRLTARAASFRNAFRGVSVLFRTQPNMRLHGAAAVSAAIAGGWLGLSRTEWLWVVAAIGAVWAAEAFNTALEFLADAVSAEYHPRIGRAKDAAAAAVLFACAAAAVIGVMVFWPHVERQFF
ncbi:MAG: diacylglycerol kinase family protein [Candidatus Hydrogenedentes bacterium]|nr:diacylglycerol kinase family protein [Candidatus Hydrogenedentota bacterium]